MSRRNFAVLDWPRAKDYCDTDKVFVWCNANKHFDIDFTLKFIFSQNW